MFANFSGVNTPATASLKLPTWCCWTWSWEEMLTLSSGELASAALRTSLMLNIFEVMFWCLKCVGLFLLSIVSTCLHSWCCASFSLCAVCLFVCELHISLELCCRWPLSSGVKFGSTSAWLISCLLHGLGALLQICNLFKFFAWVFVAVVVLFCFLLLR